jgi:hypothetical protein
MIRRLLPAWTVALCFATTAASAQSEHQHHHGGAPARCSEPTLACASAATPFLAPDGTLWLTWVAGGRVAVARSHDGGQRFDPAVLVNAAVEPVDTGPDARPRLVVDRAGRAFVSYAVFKDKAYNATALLAQSADGGKSFGTPQPLTDDPASQRFETLALDPDGRLFAAWIDKRDAVAARTKGQAYAGAALAFAWLEPDGTHLAAARIAQDQTCECCRLGVGFAGPGRPIVIFRNVFDGGVRDHAITTFTDPTTPGPIYRVSVDDWHLDVCPHQGPSLAVAADGSYHATWFTEGNARQGVFYARSTDGGRSFSTPMPIGTADRRPSRPYVITVPGAVWLAWKEFDGERTTIDAMVSRDGGTAWSKPEVVAQTDDASDHPLLVSDGHHALLSWLTAREGYRLMPLEDRP